MKYFKIFSKQFPNINENLKETRTTSEEVTIADELEKNFLNLKNDLSILIGFHRQFNLENFACNISLLESRNAQSIFSLEPRFGKGWSVCNQVNGNMHDLALHYNSHLISFYSFTCSFYFSHSVLLLIPWIYHACSQFKVSLYVVSSFWNALYQVATCPPPSLPSGFY